MLPQQSSTIAQEDETNQLLRGSKSKKPVSLINQPSVTIYMGLGSQKVQIEDKVETKDVEAAAEDCGKQLQVPNTMSQLRAGTQVTTATSDKNISEDKDVEEDIEEDVEEGVEEDVEEGVEEDVEEEMQEETEKWSKKRQVEDRKKRGGKSTNENMRNVHSGLKVVAAKKNKERVKFMEADETAERRVIVRNSMLLGCVYA
jgi:hypothetical protein